MRNQLNTIKSTQILERIGQLLRVLLAAIALTACSSPPWQPIDGEDHVPPWPLEEGPASVSGVVTMRTPSLALYSDMGGSPAYAVPKFNVQTGLFRPSADVPVRKGDYWYQTPLQVLSPGLVQLAYSFSGVPYSTYEIRLFRMDSLDWGLYEFWSFNTGQSFSIDAAQPSASGRTEQFELFGAAPYGKLSGKLLVEGNSLDSTGITLTLSPANDPLSIGGELSCSWQVVATDAQFGRSWYSLDSLPYRDYLLYASGNYYYGDVQPSFELVLDGSPSTSSKVTINAGLADRTAAIYASEHVSTMATDQSGPDPTLQGRISCVVEVQGAETWDDDIVVVAERAGGASAANQMACDYVLPGDVGVDHHAVSVLAYLVPGSYNVTVYRLGATNSDPPEVLAASTAPVELVLPPQAYDEDIVGNRYYYQPPAKATTTLAIDLSE